MHIIRKYLNEFIAKYTILFFIMVVLIVIFAGTIAFYNLEGWSFFDSIYFTSVTMSTIGYGDMAPLTHAGKLVAMFYGFMGAPLFIGFTWLLFQSKLKKMLQASIHAYHKEAREAEKISLQLEKQNRKQDKQIKEIQEEVQENIW